MWPNDSGRYCFLLAFYFGPNPKGGESVVRHSPVLLHQQRKQTDQSEGIALRLEVSILRLVFRVL